MTSTLMPWISPGVRNGYAGRKRGTILRASVAAFCFCIFGTGASAAENAPLRLCADPDNLPFTSDKADNPGIYREIGKAIAQELNRPLTEVWYRTNFGKRATRVTLLAKQCDFSVGLPGESDFMGPALIFSRPFMKAGYALVLKKPATVSSWADLNGKAIAVQQNSTPQQVLATKDNITMVTELNPEDTVKAVASGAADAAFVWAPSAGYLNKTFYSDSFNIIPVDGTGMQWPVAIAFGKRDGALRDAVNGALDRISAKIDDLKVKYGFPAAEPVTLAEAATPANKPAKSAEQAPTPDKSAEKAAVVISEGQSSSEAPAAKSEDKLTAEVPAPAKADSAPAAAAEAPAPVKTEQQIATAVGAPAQAESAPSAAADAPQAAVENAALTPPPEPLASSNEDRVREGKEVFNGTCAHCHGPNAEQAERKIDLRLLHHRYKDSMEEMFFKTVTNGRPSKGMPAWQDVFTQDQFVSILAFLKTVQAD
ncbi:MAG TPA: transporter substrate-binding domain-containing protein [Geobacterales bacterium]|nr:transporter substrate-binding domain-containing protein [Geobacterales bacterium]